MECYRLFRRKISSQENVGQLFFFFAILVHFFSKLRACDLNLSLLACEVEAQEGLEMAFAIAGIAGTERHVRLLLERESGYKSAAEGKFLERSSRDFRGSLRYAWFFLLFSKKRCLRFASKF